MEFIIVMAGFLLLLFMADKLLQKLLKVKKARLSKSPGKKASVWSRVIILIVGLCAVPFIGIETDEGLLWFLVIYLSLLQLVQAFLEWKYIRESRQHLLTLSSLPITIISLLFVGFYFI